LFSFRFQHEEKFDEERGSLYRRAVGPFSCLVYHLHCGVQMLVWLDLRACGQLLLPDLVD